jgi:hypothetical protein
MTNKRDGLFVVIVVLVLLPKKKKKKPKKIQVHKNLVQIRVVSLANAGIIGTRKNILYTIENYHVLS